MPLIECLEGVIPGMPGIVCSPLQIGRPLLDGVLVKAVEAGLVDHIEYSFLGMTDGQ